MMANLSVDFYNDDFIWFGVWFNKSDSSEFTEHFGYVWAVAISVLWWEICIVKEPKYENIAP